ncbi:hypothetical protein U9M48_001592 [Paspalum notatum var. saurae]|uniref:Uncharacterized protein n=1 Tax=Paspalum notatum var. saurae TaxID=547442 RepID=A0AAQ3PP39_PASNO
MTTTIASTTATGSHVLKVEGYSKIEGMIGYGRSIDSGAFSVGGHSWRIKCYVDGDSWVTSAYVSVFLRLEDDHPAGADDSAVDARLQFSLLDQQPGGDGEPYTKPSQRDTFSKHSRSCGYDRFIAAKDLDSSSPFLKDDTLLIRCDVTVLKQTRTETAPGPIAAAPVVPPPDLHRHLGALLDGKVVGGDVTFEVGGELFPAHRYVLAARSPVFKAELFGPMKERTGGARVPVADMEAGVFKVLLRFIYTDALPEVDDGHGGGGDKAVMAQHLLVAADRYGMERLRLICEDMLCGCIDASTAATTLVLAEQHGCHGLMEACFVFLKCQGNLKAVMESDGFQYLKSSSPSLLEELLAKVAT